LAEPCGDFFAALERREAPPGLAEVVRVEVRLAVDAAVERLHQGVEARLREALAAAAREQEDWLRGALKGEGDRWAEACVGQLAETLAKEQQGRTSLERRLVSAEGQLATQVAEMRREVVRACGEADARLGSRLAELREANESLQAVLDRYAKRWERAWYEEAEARAGGDRETRESLESLQASMLEARPVGEERRTEARSDTHLFEEVTGELRLEAKQRSETDARLAANIEQLRALVSKVVGTIERQHRQANMNVIAAVPDNGALPQAVEHQLTPPSSPPPALRNLPAPLRQTQVVRALPIRSSPHLLAR